MKVRVFTLKERNHNMKRKIALASGVILLCTVMLTGCNGVRTEASETASVISVQQESEASQKFKSATNYQEGGEYYKAYILYKEVPTNAVDYEEAQSCAQKALELYWKQQEELIEKGDYEKAIEYTVSSMSFIWLKSPLKSEDGLETTILEVAEKLAESIGFTNPVATMKEAPIYGYLIDIDCDEIEGTEFESLPLETIQSKYVELDNKILDTIYRKSMSYASITLGEIHADRKWYRVEDDKLSVTTDSERVKEKIEARKNNSAVQDSENKYTGPVTQECQNALTKGLQYANNLYMSRKAVYNQLTSSYGEGFSTDAAQYAIDHMTGVDWNANALEKAKQYYYNMSMSKSAVYDQLTSEYGEQFTASEAQYAIDHLS